MKTTSLGFIGGGRITRIILQAFANKDMKFEKIVVFDINTVVLNALKDQFPEIVIADTIQQAAQQSTVFIALHPPVIMETLEKVSNDVSNATLVVSLAPKITIEKLTAKLKTPNTVRMIPNATSYINEGYNPVTFSSEFNPVVKIDVLKFFDLLGFTFEVPEEKLEAYAIISAMLPTYFWFQWQEVKKIGFQIGLTEAESSKALEQTLSAAVNLMFKSGLSPEQVIDLIPVKPIGENEQIIKDCYREKLIPLFEKIKP